jgi:hypothetical protein
MFVIILLSDVQFQNGMNKLPSNYGMGIATRPTTILRGKEKFRNFCPSETGISAFGWPSISRLGQIPDWDVTYILRNIGRQALADFFAFMVMPKADWYNLTNPSPSDVPHTMINSIFPTLSTLLSVESKIMDSMLQLCGLSQERRGENDTSVERGLIMDGKKKMDAVEVEVMLSEEGLCKDNSRILFRPIFWEEHFESEYKTCAFLPELNFHLSQTKWFFRIQPSWIIGSSSLM